jgi:hypothetical protein
MPQTATDRANVENDKVLAAGSPSGGFRRDSLAVEEEVICTDRLDAPIV